MFERLGWWTWQSDNAPVDKGNIRAMWLYLGGCLGTLITVNVIALCNLLRSDIKSVKNKLRQ